MCAREREREKDSFQNIKLKAINIMHRSMTKCDIFIHLSAIHGIKEADRVIARRTHQVKRKKEEEE